MPNTRTPVARPRPVSELTVSPGTADTDCLLTVEGVLDTTTYLKLRDSIVKAALDEPRAVLVDVNALDVPASSAWSVFTSARWHVSTWPDIPVVLISARAEQPRRTIARTGVTRYVPVYPSVEAALATLTDDAPAARRRIRAELPAALASLRTARTVVADCLQRLVSGRTHAGGDGDRQRLRRKRVATHHLRASGGDRIRRHIGEHLGRGRQRGPGRAPRGSRPRRRSCLVWLSSPSVCRAGAACPRPSGKTVWAVIGPENRL